jgi:hypothetical protein
MIDRNHELLSPPLENCKRRAITTGRLAARLN